MKTLRITNVLNVSIQCPKPDFIDDAHFLRIPLNDGHAAKILPFFDIAFRFIGLFSFRFVSLHAIMLILNLKKKNAAKPIQMC